MKEIFHVHTYRCGHAEEIPDKAYIEQAIQLKANRITFTDHAPFPNDPFTNRMHYEELEEYISTLHNLKMAYKEKIDVKIGLEVEYLPSFEDYYKELKANPKIDVLLLGQHHFEIMPSQYSFQQKCDAIPYTEAILKAQIQGIRSGFFDVLAHPERYIRTESEHIFDLERELIRTAIENNIPLEKNRTTYLKNEVSEHFWSMVPESAKTIVGYDAHKISDLPTNDN